MACASNSMRSIRYFTRSPIDTIPTSRPPETTGRCRTRLANQLFPILGWFLGTLVGGWFAIRLSGRDWTVWLIAASVLVGELLDYLLGRHNAWVMIAGILAPLVAAWAAQKLPGGKTRLSA